MGVPLVWRLKLAHYVPKIGKSNKKRCLATIWPLRWCQAKYGFLLLLFIVPPIYTIIHAWHYIRERYRIICTYDVHRVPYTRTIRTLFWIHTSTTRYVVLAIGAAVALPWSLVGEIKVGKIKEPQSGTITFGLKLHFYPTAGGFKKKKKKSYSSAYGQENIILEVIKKYTYRSRI